MADTARSLADLQTLLADNTSRDITPQRLRDFLLSTFSGYGGLYTETDQTFTVEDTVEFADNMISSDDVTPDHTANSITVTVGGTYLIMCSMSFKSFSTSGDYTLTPRVNGSYDGSTGGARAEVGGSQPLAIVFVGLLSLDADDVLTMYLTGPGGSTAVSQSAQLVIKRIA